MDIEKIESLKNLSKSAINAGSYKDAYKYSSSLLEIDPSLNEAWLIKAASAAGLMADSDDIKFEEIVFCLEQGAKGASENDIGLITNAINKSYKQIINRLDHILKDKIIDHQKVPMPLGGSVLLHRVAQKGYARLTAKALSQKRLNAIKLLEKSYHLRPDEDSLRLLVGEVDSFLSHSSEYDNYLNDEEETKTYITKLNSILSQKANESGVVIDKLPPKSSGCFIATAATGSYEHPKVIILRIFRDDVLKSYSLGRIFIKAYYKCSPPIARWIEERKNRKNIILWLVVNPLSLLAERALKIFHSKHKAD